MSNYREQVHQWLDQRERYVCGNNARKGELIQEARQKIERAINDEQVQSIVSNLGRELDRI